MSINHQPTWCCWPLHVNRNPTYNHLVIAKKSVVWSLIAAPVFARSSVPFFDMLGVVIVEVGPVYSMMNGRFWWITRARWRKLSDFVSVLTLWRLNASWRHGLTLVEPHIILTGRSWSPTWRKWPSVERYEEESYEDEPRIGLNRPIFVLTWGRWPSSIII